MSVTIKTKIDRFDGGITNNPHDSLSNKAKGLRNFDVLTDPFTLIPYRDSEDGDTTNPTTTTKTNYAIARRTGTTYSLYALGTQTDGNDSLILSKELTTTSTDLSDGAWSTPSNNAGGNTTTQFDVFTYYQNQNEIYYISDSRYISAFSPTGSAIIDQEADLGAGIVNTAEGLVHSKNDNCFIPFDNKIAVKDGTNAFVTASLGIPAHMKITCVAEYGNYLAVGCAPLSGIGESIALLWNMNTTLTEASEVINFGDGELRVIETLNGQLMGISLLGGDTTRLQDKIMFRRYTGASDAEKILELAEDTSVANASTQLLSVKQKTDGRVLFMMRFALHGVDRAGVWSFGKASPTQPWTLVHESTPDDDASVSSIVLKGFFKVGEYTFQSFINSGTFAVTKTNNSSTSYTASSIYESTINPDMDKDFDAKTKQLKGFWLRYNVLDGSNDSVKAEVRVDGGSWIEIFTETGAALITEATKDVNGRQFKKGREFEYRVTSTGGGEVIEIGANYETEEDKVV